jgi:hypothetical protein
MQVDTPPPPIHTTTQVAPSTTDRVIDAAATIGRVTSYFSIAGSTIVLTITDKGDVHEVENIGPSVGSVGVFLLVRSRRLVGTTWGVVTGDPVCTGRQGTLHDPASGFCQHERSILLHSTREGF